MSITYTRTDINVTGQYCVLYWTVCFISLASQPLPTPYAVLGALAVQDVFPIIAWIDTFPGQTVQWMDTLLCSGQTVQWVGTLVCSGHTVQWVDTAVQWTVEWTEYIGPGCNEANVEKIVEALGTHMRWEAQGWWTWKNKEKQLYFANVLDLYWHLFTLIYSCFCFNTVVFP